MRNLGVQHLRTGLSWADYHRPGGKAWYQWQMEQLREFNVLLSIWHTPPSIAEKPDCAAPPRRLHDYGDFVAQVIDEFGDDFDTLELWNEPNNRYKWDFHTFDPKWAKFGAMIRHAAKQAKMEGKTTVLGGMIPVDHRWLGLMKQCRALENIDVVAIHGFPGMWWDGEICWESRSAWHGWKEKIRYIREYAEGRPVWVTETGMATWDLDRGCLSRFEEQVVRMDKAMHAPAERVYWYSLMDLHPEREAIEGFHVDENEYHLGLVTAEGKAKPAYGHFEKMLKQANTNESGVHGCATSHGEASHGWCE